MQGQRGISLGALLGLIAVLAIGAALLLFIVSLYGTANSARDAEQNLRQIIQSRCEDRVAYDNRFITSARGDLEFYATLDRLAKANPIPPGTDPKIIKLYDEQRNAIAKQEANKQAIVGQGVIGNCAVFTR